MKEIIKAIGYGILVTAIVVGGVAGLVWLITYKDNQNKQDADKGCSQIAELVGTKEWKTDSSYNCILVKDGKIITVEDW